MEGPRFLVFSCFTLLKMNEKLLLASRNTHELMMNLDSVTNQAFKIDDLLDVSSYPNKRGDSYNPQETFKQFHLLSENDFMERYFPSYVLLQSIHVVYQAFEVLDCSTKRKRYENSAGYVHATRSDLLVPSIVTFSHNSFIDYSKLDTTEEVVLY